MTRLLVLLLVAVAAVAVWGRLEDDRRDRDLWAEITDTVD